MTEPPASQPPERGPLTWRWVAVTAAAFVGIFVGPISGSPALGYFCVGLFGLCVLDAMGLTGRRKKP
jgi:hypothetical protein